MVGFRALILLLGLTACSTNNTRNNDQMNAPASNAANAGVATSVSVEVSASDVRLVFHITNTSSQPIVLEFGTGQRYDFAVRKADGSEVWRWSRDQMFTQALGSETIPAGGGIEYRATWPSSEVGEFTAIAELTALNLPLEQRTKFERRP